MSGLAAPKLLCLRQAHLTLKGTATTHRTRNKENSSRQGDAHKDIERHEAHDEKCAVSGAWEARAKVSEAWEGACGHVKVCK
jgi:hypothetical protein